MQALCRFVPYSSHTLQPALLLPVTYDGRSLVWWSQKRQAHTAWVGDPSWRYEGVRVSCPNADEAQAQSVRTTGISDVDNIKRGLTANFCQSEPQRLIPHLGNRVFSTQCQTETTNGLIFGLAVRWAQASNGSRSTRWSRALSRNTILSRQAKKKKDAISSAPGRSVSGVRTYFTEYAECERQ